MILKIANVLTPAQVAQVVKRLESADWVDGGITAGPQSARAKHNLQVPEDAPEALELGGLILETLRHNPIFVSAALPLRVFPPLFNRYDVGMGFGDHVDNAIRFSQASRFRTDLSCTLFLSDPDTYDGGELVIGDHFVEQKIKLTAGDMILYPATSLHNVQPITRGSRWASFFWAQSMVRSAAHRGLLFDMDQSLQTLTKKLGSDDKEVIALTGTYHNLVRLWADL
jgi:PKHD-type hydroxylase